MSGYLAGARRASYDVETWLDEIAVVGDERYQDDYRVRQFLSETDDDDNHRANAFWDAPIADLLAWAQEDQATRVVALAERVPYFRPGTEGFAWTNVAESLISLAGTEVAVLSAFEGRFPYGGASGSYAGRYLRRRPLAEHFLDHANEAVRDWARRALVEIDRQIEIRSRLDGPRAEIFE